MDNATICNLLNDYLFKNVWNEPGKEFNRLIKLNRYRDRSFTGSFTTPSYTIKLPTTSEPYYIFWIDKSKLSYNYFNLENKKWKSLFDINQSKFFLSAVNDGKQLFTKSTFFYRYEPSDDIFVAVSKAMMEKYYDYNYNPNDTYLKVYYDWDLEDETESHSFHLIDQTTRAAAWNSISSDTTSILINGERRKSIVYPDLVIGDFVEIINDNNIKFQFEVDLTTDTGKRVFLSTETNKLYTIVHIPKSFNSDNRIITYNTVDIYIYPKNSNSNTTNGLLLYSKTLKYKQITHNDFGIPEDLITAYSNLVGTEELVLVVQVKIHDKNNVLVRDKNYIDLLYRHDDETILNFLEGSESTNLYFWRADILSQSKYTKYMTSTPTFVDASNLNTFIDVFGYQYVLSLLMDNIRRFQYGPNIEYPFVVKRPALFDNDILIPLLFINGIKVRNDNLTVVNRSNPYFSIEILDPNITLQENDECIIELLERSNLSTMSFSPISTNNHITLGSMNYSVYREGDIGSPVQGIEVTYDKFYDPMEIEDDIYVINKVTDGYMFTFTPSSYGRKYILVPNEGSIFFKELDVDIQNTNPLFVDLTIPVSNDVIEIPTINSISTKVFLNGLTLVEGVDYKFIKHKFEGILCGTQIVIYNVSYLRDDTNYVEVIISRNDCEKSYTFFNTEDENVVKNVFHWFNTTGTASIDGKQVFRIEKTNDGILINDSHRSGAIVETTSLYPKQVKSFVEAYQSDEADIKNNIIVQYFNSIVDTYNGIVSIPFAHSLYSIRTCMIIRDILNNNTNIVLEPSRLRMLQAISDYDYLIQFDILNEDLNTNFIDFHSVYREVVAINPSVYRLIDYIGKLLITDPITLNGLE